MENNFWEKKCNEMEQFSAKGNTRAFFESLKTIYGPAQSKKLVLYFKKTDRTLTQSISESLERLQEYYSALLNSKICISQQVEFYIWSFRGVITGNHDNVLSNFQRIWLRASNQENQSNVTKSLPR